MRRVQLSSVLITDTDTAESDADHDTERVKLEDRVNTVKMTRSLNTRSHHSSRVSSKHCDDLNKKKRPETVSDPGLLNRTAWTNAAVALDHIKKVTISDLHPYK